MRSVSRSLWPDADERLLRRLDAPPPLDEALETRRYWHARVRSLPWHRRAERREAAELAARWDDRVRTAARRELIVAPAPAVRALLELRRARFGRAARRVAVAGVAGVLALGAAAGVAADAVWDGVAPVLESVVD